MKKTIFVLPLCAFLAFCGSSRKVATPAGPGISNVNVSRADTMTSAEKAGASFTSADRDWSYKGTRDTILNGTWTLDGITGADGNWSSTQSWYKDTSVVATDTSLMAMDATGTTTTTTATTGTGTTTKATRSKSRGKNRKALYDSANARLKYNFRDSSVLDTTVQPFQYWKRIPTVTLNAKNLIFTGNTGCNSMSGSFNFSDKDIQFGRNIVTSKMMCNEYDENIFLSALKKADNYTLNGNVLELKQGSTLLLSFRKT